MAKPIATPTTFAGSPPPWTLSLLDTNNTNAAGALNDLGTYENFFADSGSVNAIAVLLSTGLTASLIAGLAVTVLIANTTTSSSVTLTVGSLGAVTVKNQDLTSPLVGQLVAGSVVKFIYDGTYFQILGASSSGSSGTSSLVIAAGGFSGTVNFTLTWFKTGGIVLASISPATGASNGATFTLSGIPTAITPTTTNQRVAVPTTFFENNSTQLTATSCVTATVTTANLLQFELNASASGWTASGTKGILSNNISMAWAVF
jgi:hypothetical protein